MEWAGMEPQWIRGHTCTMVGNGSLDCVAGAAIKSARAFGGKSGGHNMEADIPGPLASSQTVQPPF